ncbi:MAG TPA: hypothetical protein VGJ09_03030, partial [Bryobacteraceae bacterium]
MTALSKIENAIAVLSEREQKALLAFLSRRIRSNGRKSKRGLSAASRPPLQGLPADLSVNTRDKVRQLIHAAN